jgi:hypothetical protein
MPAWSTLGTIAEVLEGFPFKRDMYCSRSGEATGSPIFTAIRIREYHASSCLDGKVWSVELKSSDAITQAFIQFAKTKKRELALTIDEDEKDTVVLCSDYIVHILQTLIIANFTRTQ